MKKGGGLYVPSPNFDFISLCKVHKSTCIFYAYKLDLVIKSFSEKFASENDLHITQLSLTIGLTSVHSHLRSTTPKLKIRRQLCKYGSVLLNLFIKSRMLERKTECITRKVIKLYLRVRKGEYRYTVITYFRAVRENTDTL